MYYYVRWYFEQFTAKALINSTISSLFLIGFRILESDRIIKMYVDYGNYIKCVMKWNLYEVGKSSTNVIRSVKPSHACSYQGMCI